jgi:carbamoyltransferase
MRVILGITDGDDGGAALLLDGRLLAAVNEERLNRLKMSIGFPRLAVREVLRLGGIGPGDVDHVAMAAKTEVHIPVPKPNKGWFQRASAVGRIRNEISSALARPLGNFPPAFTAYRALKRVTMGRRRNGVRTALRELGVRAPVTYHEHHRCHTVAAYEAAGFEDAVSISLDGGGDGHCSHVWVLEDGRDQLLNTLDSFHSIGNFYAYVTHLCGYRATIHEGKITGLSASGEARYLDMFQQLITFRDGQIRNIGRVYHTSALAAMRNMLPADWEHEDLAASVQAHLEDVAVAYVRHWVQVSGKRRVCLSGGVFANVRLNQKIAELPECDATFVFPHMGDGGLAAGAALCAWRDSKDRRTSREDSFLPHVYLGPSFGDDEIETALKNGRVDYWRPDDIEVTCAELIHQGRVVARFNGAMEFGPRALGNRTIMYHTKDPSVNAWLNKRLRRTEFMPFAPACLAGYEDLLFDWNPASERPTRFMTITLDCSDWMKQHCPAVVHVDGTARPQIVDEATNPSFHRIINHYHQLSGIPAIVNTSFNMHEEPIVCTPEDAVRAFVAGELDNLAIGPFMAGKPPSAETVRD